MAGGSSHPSRGKQGLGARTSQRRALNGTSDSRLAPLRSDCPPFCCRGTARLCCSDHAAAHLRKAGQTHRQRHPFQHGRTQAQRGWVTSPRSHSPQDRDGSSALPCSAVTKQLHQWDLLLGAQSAWGPASSLVCVRKPQPPPPDACQPGADHSLGRLLLRNS